MRSEASVVPHLYGVPHCAVSLGRVGGAQISHCECTARITRCFINWVTQKQFLPCWCAWTNGWVLFETWFCHFWLEFVFELRMDVLKLLQTLALLNINPSIRRRYFIRNGKVDLKFAISRFKRPNFAEFGCQNKWFHNCSELDAEGKSKVLSLVRQYTSDTRPLFECDGTCCYVVTQLCGQAETPIALENLKGAAKKVELKTKRHSGASATCPNDMEVLAVEEVACQVQMIQGPVRPPQMQVEFFRTIPELFARTGH